MEEYKKIFYNQQSFSPLYTLTKLSLFLCDNWHLLIRTVLSIILNDWTNSLFEEGLIIFCNKNISPPKFFSLLFLINEIYIVKLQDRVLAPWGPVAELVRYYANLLNVLYKADIVTVAPRTYN